VFINNILPVITLSLLAGMMTGLGGLIAIISKPGRRSFGFLIGIAAGVMITLSFLDLVNETWTHSGFLTVTIVETANQTEADLIILSIHHRTGLDAFWSPSVTATVARWTEILLLVPITETPVPD
jgi:zinc transporter ZupT